MSLALHRYRLRFVAETPVRFGAFAGSAWRGVLGRQLKRLVCVMRGRPCEGCPLERSCPYPVVFEPRPRPDLPLMRRYERVPTPYLLDPRTPTPVALEPGEAFELEVRILGGARRHALYVLKALELGAAQGIGLGRGRLQLAAVEGPEERTGPDGDSGAAGPVRVHLERPLRLVYEGRLLGPDRFTARAFLMPLVRRIGLLAAFYGKPPDWDFRALKLRAQSVPVLAQQLRWQEQTRRSARQGGLTPMGGLVGSFTLDLGAAPEFGPLLAFGRWLHLGKGASMGMGKYRTAPAGRPAEAPSHQRPS